MHVIIGEVDVGHLVVQAAGSEAVAQDNKRRTNTQGQFAYYPAPFSTFNAPRSQREKHAVMANNEDELCKGNSE